MSVHINGTGYGTNNPDPAYKPDTLSAPTAPASAPMTAVPAASVNNPGASPITGDILAAGVGSRMGDTNLISSNNAIPATDYFYPADLNQAGRGATYDGPVAIPRWDDRSPGVANNAGYNQLMFNYAQHFDPMVQYEELTHPTWWFSKVPRSQYKLFDGVEHSTRIFRGGLYTYAGLSRWQDIKQADETGATDPCGSLPYTTVKYGWEELSWRGKRMAWGSDPICLDMFKYWTQAQEQLANIISFGAREGIHIMEVWNRDMFIYQSVAFGRSFIMTKDFMGPSSAKYYYNPFADPSKITDAGLKAAVNGKAYALIPEGTMPEPLNFDVLDQVRNSLAIRCPRSAVSGSGGTPMFGLTISDDDLERYIRGNEEERRYWLEDRPAALIQHDGFAPTTYRHWVLTNDGNQLRFKIVAKVEITADNRGMFADDNMSETNVPNGTYFVCVAVDPRIASKTRIGIQGTPIPEDNPEYYMAEFAVAVVFMNHVFTNQLVPSLSSLGSGTKFGPDAGRNGSWTWINIPDRETNPLGKVGNFYGIFEIFPKPETSVVHATSFMYRRCVAALPSFCPQENVKIIAAATATSTTVAKVETLDVGIVRLTLSDRLAGVKVGSEVTVGGSTGFVVGMPGLQLIDVQTDGSDSDASGDFTVSVGAEVALAG